MNTHNKKIANRTRVIAKSSCKTITPIEPDTPDNQYTPNTNEINPNDLHNPDINLILDNEVKIILNKDTKHLKEILVLSGGGKKGVAQVGALHCLKKNNLLNNIKTIAASSVGSVNGLLLCAGYHPMEIFRTKKARAI